MEKSMVTEGGGFLFVLPPEVALAISSRSRDPSGKPPMGWLAADFRQGRADGGTES